MRRHLRSIAAAFVAAIAGGEGVAAQHADHMALVPSGAAIGWQPAPADLPKGSPRIAVLAGDPGKPGPFVLRVKFPPNTLVAPHRHATDENLTVLSGEVHHDVGEKLDRARGDRLEPGGFVYLPGGMPHSVWTAATEGVVQVTGTGPFGLVYVNPEDGPGKAR